MQTLNWLGNIGSLDDAQKMINDFCWSLSVQENDGMWYVTTGNVEKHVIFQADNREAVEAFIYGMALAYSGFPQHLYDELMQRLKAWLESL